jgi:hypothetical protein
MLFCSRGRTYRIFHAQSNDGIEWNSEPNRPVLDLEPGSWDSEMTCYPCVFEHLGRHYLLYNGNDYGRDGFGIAVAE